MFFKLAQLWNKLGGHKKYQLHNIGVDDGLDVGFYGTWYSDLTRMDPSQLVKHWKQHGSTEGRYPNFNALLRDNALPDNALPLNFTADLFEELNPCLAHMSYWNACIKILRQNPVTPYFISMSPEENTAFYGKLSAFYTGQGAPDKGLALANIAEVFNCKAPIDDETVATTFLAAEQENFEQGPIDYEFYRVWHPDLAGFDNAKLLQHWELYGRSERRVPNFPTLLAASDLSHDALPADFDPDDYLLLNPSLIENGVNNKFAAIFHYLQHGMSKKLQYRFDPKFYLDFNDDIAKIVVNPMMAREHWKLYGINEGRLPNFNSCLVSLNLVEVPRALSLTPENYTDLNPPLAHLSYYRSLFIILQQDPPTPYRVSYEAKKNSQFYYELALAYSIKNKKELSTELFKISCMFSTHPLAIEQLGNVALDNNRFSDAVQLYRQSCTTGPITYWSSYNLIVALQKQGDFAAALSATYDFVQAFPGRQTVTLTRDIVVKQYWDQAYNQLTNLASVNEREELLKHALSSVEAVASVYEASALSTAKKPIRASLNRTRVLIVGDFSLPQCKRYRITQKIEQLNLAGYDALALHWDPASAFEKELIFRDIIIFYRVPAFPDIIRAIVNARALGKLTIYEIDDLLFDPEAFPPPIDTYGGTLHHSHYSSLLMAMVLNRTAAILCDYGLASTPLLAEHLTSLVRRKKSFVHRNALDSENKTFFMNIPTNKNNKIKVFYGSGTLAHNSDFIQEALPALDKLLQTRPQVILILAGHLHLPITFLERYQQRVVQVPLITSIHSYWSVLCQADINIAVLEDNEFNNCKSELKWLEAGYFAIPSVVSYTKTYAGVIRSMEDGIIARGPTQFYTALLRLVDDDNFRKKMGQAAKTRIHSEYSLKTMAQNITFVLEEIIDEFQPATSEHSQGSTYEET